MSLVEDNVLDAIDVMVSHAVLSAEYDKTIKATVKSVIDASLGKYKLTYQNSTLEAYASSPDVTYEEGVLVYVTIPSNDLAKRKIILGLVSDDDTIVNTYTSLKEKYLYDGNVIVDDGFAEHSLCSYTYDFFHDYGDYELTKPGQCKYLYLYNEELESAAGGLLKPGFQVSDELYEALINNGEIIANGMTKGWVFETLIDSDTHIYKGVGVRQNKFANIYRDRTNDLDGFIFGASDPYITTKESRGVKTSFPREQFTGLYGAYNLNVVLLVGTDYIVYTLSSSEMNGDSYNFKVYTPQAKKIQDGGDSAFVRIEAIYISSYYFPIQEQDKPDDIFFKDIFLQTYRTREIEDKGLTVTLDAPSGTLFDANNNTLPIKASLYNGGKEVNVTNRKCFYWFVADSSIDASSSEGYMSYAGDGWRCLNSNKVTTNDGYTYNPQGNTISVSSVKKQRNYTYLCIADYGGLQTQAKINFTNENGYSIKFTASGVEAAISSQNELALFGETPDTEVTISAIVKDSGGNTITNNCGFSWSVVDRSTSTDKAITDGYYDSENSIEFPVSLIMDKKLTVFTASITYASESIGQSSVYVYYSPDGEIYLKKDGTVNADWLNIGPASSRANHPNTLSVGYYNEPYGNYSAAVGKANKISANGSSNFVSGEDNTVGLFNNSLVVGKENTLSTSSTTAIESNAVFGNGADVDIASGQSNLILADGAEVNIGSNGAVGNIIIANEDTSVDKLYNSLLISKGGSYTNTNSKTNNIILLDEDVSYNGDMSNSLLLSQTNSLTTDITTQLTNSIFVCPYGSDGSLMNSIGIGAISSMRSYYGILVMKFQSTESTGYINSSLVFADGSLSSIDVNGALCNFYDVPTIGEYTGIYDGGIYSISDGSFDGYHYSSIISSDQSNIETSTHGCIVSLYNYSTLSSTYGSNFCGNIIAGYGTTFSLHGTYGSSLYLGYYATINGLDSGRAEVIVSYGGTINSSGYGTLIFNDGRYYTISGEGFIYSYSSNVSNNLLDSRGYGHGSRSIITAFNATVQMGGVYSGLHSFMSRSFSYNNKYFYNNLILYGNYNSSYTGYLVTASAYGTSNTDYGQITNSIMIGQGDSLSARNNTASFCTMVGQDNTISSGTDSWNTQLLGNIAYGLRNTIVASGTYSSYIYWNLAFGENNTIFSQETSSSGSYHVCNTAIGVNNTINNSKFAFVHGQTCVSVNSTFSTVLSSYNGCVISGSSHSTILNCHDGVNVANVTRGLIVNAQQGAGIMNSTDVVGMIFSSGVNVTNSDHIFSVNNHTGSSVSGSHYSTSINNQQSSVLTDTTNGVMIGCLSGSGITTHTVNDTTYSSSNNLLLLGSASRLMGTTVSVSIGYSNTATKSDYVSILGHNNSINSANNSYIIGKQNSLGDTTLATDSANNYVFGLSNTITSSNNNWVIGQTNTIVASSSGLYIFGTSNTESSAISDGMVLGWNNIVGYAYQTVMGYYNISDTTNSSLLIIGNGTSTTRSNAFVVSRNGTITASGDVIDGNGNTLAAASTIFTGTDGTSNGVKGLVPAPLTTDEDSFLCSDGTWTSIAQTYSGTATPSTLLGNDGDYYVQYDNEKVVADFIKIDGSWLEDEKYNIFTGTDGTTDSDPGIVPSVSASNQGSFLHSDGSWAYPLTISSTVDETTEASEVICGKFDNSYIYRKYVSATVTIPAYAGSMTSATFDITVLRDVAGKVFVDKTHSTLDDGTTVWNSLNTCTFDFNAAADGTDTITCTVRNFGEWTVDTALTYNLVIEYTADFDTVSAFASWNDVADNYDNYSDTTTDLTSWG